MERWISGDSGKTENDKLIRDTGAAIGLRRHSANYWWYWRRDRVDNFGACFIHISTNVESILQVSPKQCTPHRWAPRRRHSGAMDTLFRSAALAAVSTL